MTLRNAPPPKHTQRPKNMNGCEYMDKTANPKTANGKRGLYSEGMNNNMNKAVRCLEDTTTAFIVHGHPMMCQEGMNLLKAGIAYAKATIALTKAYNEYAPKYDLGVMTLGGAKVITNATAQMMLIQAQLDKAKDNEATNTNKKKK